MSPAASSAVVSTKENWNHFYRLNKIWAIIYFVHNSSKSLVVNPEPTLNDNKKEDVTYSFIWIDFWPQTAA